MTVRVQQLIVHSDERGIVFEPLDCESFAVQQNAHVVLTAPGRVRGNHYHRAGHESIAVLGPARVRYREGEHIVDMTIPMDEAHRFEFPPGTPHAIQHTGSGTGVLVAFSTHPHDPEDPDTVADILIPIDDS